MDLSNQAKNSNDKDVCYFADLPGYGYAKMSKDKQRTIEVGVVAGSVGPSPPC